MWSPIVFVFHFLQPYHFHRVLHCLNFSFLSFIPFLPNSSHHPTISFLISCYVFQSVWSPIIFVFHFFQIYHFHRVLHIIPTISFVVAFATFSKWFGFVPYVALFCNKIFIWVMLSTRPVTSNAVILRRIHVVTFQSNCLVLNRRRSISLCSGSFLHWCCSASKFMSYVLTWEGRITYNVTIVTLIKFLEAADLYLTCEPQQLKCDNL